MGWSKLQHVFDVHRDPRSGRWIARAHLPRHGAFVYLDSEEGRAWLESEQTRSFCFVSERGTMTVRKERGRRGGWYWYAYRWCRGRTRKRYIGTTAALTTRRLVAIAEEFTELLGEGTRGWDWAGIPRQLPGAAVPVAELPDEEAGRLIEAWWREYAPRTYPGLLRRIAQRRALEACATAIILEYWQEHMPAMYAALLQQGKVEHEARSRARRVVGSLRRFCTFAEWRATVQAIVASPPEGVKKAPEPSCLHAAGEKVPTRCLQERCPQPLYAEPGRYRTPARLPYRRRVLLPVSPRTPVHRVPFRCRT
jgi:hypothetical protein